MIRRVLDRSIRIALLLMLGVNATLIVGVLIERGELRSVSAHYERNVEGRPLPRLDGFLRSGTPLDLMRGSRGVAVRYAASGCPFCRQDEQWSRLAPKLQERGLQVIILLPEAKQEFADSTLIPKEAQQGAYVSVEWINRYRLTLAPSLLIFDSQQRLIWHREGTLSPADTEAAIVAVEAAAAAR